MAPIYKVEEITTSGEVTVSVTIGERSYSQSGFLPVGDLVDADKLKAYCEKLCAEAEWVLDKIMATKIDASSMTIDPQKVQDEKGKL